MWFAIGFHSMANYTEMGIFGPPNTGNLAPTGSTSLVLHPERSEGRKN